MAGNRSHIYLIGDLPGLTITGNVFYKGVLSDTPYLVEFNAVRSGIIQWQGNGDSDGWATAPFLDTNGAASSNPCVLADGFLIPVGVGGPGTATDTLLLIISGMNPLLVKRTPVYLKENRNLYGDARLENIQLVGLIPVTLTSGAGSLQNLGALHNVTWAGVNYTLENGLQYQSQKPADFVGNQWEAGALILNKPAAGLVLGNQLGWVKIGSAWVGIGVPPIVSTVALLPTGASGLRAIVTDATTNTFGATVVGGGSLTVPVFWDGTSWKIG